MLSFPNGRLRRRHVDELERLDRYLSDEGRSARSQLCRLVQEKDDLDYQEKPPTTTASVEWHSRFQRSACFGS